MHPPPSGCIVTAGIGTWQHGIGESRMCWQTPRRQRMGSVDEHRYLPQRSSGDRGSGCYYDHSSARTDCSQM